MAEITVDEDRLPVVVVTFPDVVSIEQLERLFARYELLSRRHPRVAYIIDFSRYNPVLGPADVRNATSALLQKHRDVLLRSTVCEARVVPGTFMRTALTAFDAVSPNKWPCAHFATMSEAEKWVADQLARPTARR
ncbi:MAG: hypothetical protein H6717_14105 [Polyangiaceae bacterium]|nr:hypothetical protein [Polyangiaceae bacterium]